MVPKISQSSEETAATTTEEVRKIAVDGIKQRFNRLNEEINKIDEKTDENFAELQNRITELDTSLTSNTNEKNKELKIYFEQAVFGLKKDFREFQNRYEIDKEEIYTKMEKHYNKLLEEIGKVVVESFDESFDDSMKRRKK